MSNESSRIDGAGPKRRVEVRRDIAAPIREVWTALVDADAIARWFTDASLEPREGGRLELRFGALRVTGRIKAFMPPYVLAYTWEQAGESTSLVQFDLVELSPESTRVTVVQSSLDEHAGDDVLSGWKEMLGRLRHLFES